MADWYIAPDSLTKTGLTFGTIGAGGYGHSWTNAVKWSQFQSASGCWANRANSDVFHFLSAGRNYAVSNSASWAALTLNKTGCTFQGETLDGTPSPATFVGTRDWPWPKAGNTATYTGETFMQLSSTATTPTFKNLNFRSMRYVLTTQNNGAATDYGTITFQDCSATNTHGALFSTQTKTDGRCNLVLTRVRCHGYSGGAHKMWANNSGSSVVATDFGFDSEHQNDNTSFNNATATSGIHVQDSIPGVNSVKSLATLTRGFAINHAAGLTGSGYPQGDGVIFEENVGTANATDMVTWGNGDRGWDAKCAGMLTRFTSLGDGTGGVGHHLDTAPMSMYQTVIYAGARLTSSTSPPNSVCLQSSGWTQSFQSFLRAAPTSTQTAFNSYAASTGTIDPAKFQSAIYGSTHQGKVELTDTYENVRTSTSATETVGYSNSAVNTRLAVIFGLTASTAYNFKVRAVDPTGVAGPYTADIAYTTSASGGDTTGPAAPTGLTATAQTGGTDIVFTWTSLAEDAGTSIQGYVILIDFSDGAGYVPTMPGKSCSPLRLTGFKPATAYSVKIAAYDANNNLGTASGAVAVTTLAGSVSASTPSVPLNVAVDGGFPITTPTSCGLGKAGSSPTTGWDVPATGTATYYEVANSSGGAILARVMSSPSTGSAPTLTKTNVTVTNF